MHNSTVMKFQVFDKTAFVEARRHSRVRNDRSKRHSSLEPAEVQHIESDSGMYALITKHPAGKKSDNSLLSSAVRAQLPLDAAKQMDIWEKEEKKQGKGDARNPEYVQLDFHAETTPPNGKKFTVADSPPRPVDTGKTKFGYSTVVFEKEKKTDVEFAERVKQKKPSPPLPPPKYKGSGTVLQTHSSDSKLLYSTVDFAKTNNPTATTTGGSAPDLAQSSEGTDDGSGLESPYVNVIRPKIPPVVPPRRGTAAIVEEQSPTLPMR